MGVLGPARFVGEEEAAPGTLLHYTSQRALRAILRSGVLRPHRTLPGDRVALLWFSSNNRWEPASGRPLCPGLGWQPMTFERFCQTQGAARVVVDASCATLDWPQLRQLICPHFLALAEQPGNWWFQANCHRWHATTHPVE